MAIVMTGTFPKFLRPGIKDVFGVGYNQFPPEWAEIFTKNTSTLSYEEDVLISMTGQAVLKPEGGGVTYDSMRQGYVSRYNHITTGLGYIITMEEKMDNQYAELSTARAQAIGRSLADLKEQIAANVLNLGFTNTGPDGVSLFDASHPVTGGTQSNLLSPALAFSETALEEISVLASEAKNDRGLPVRIVPLKVIIPTKLKHEAVRILENPARPGTAERDINAMFKLGEYPEGYRINRRLTDEKAFFALTDCPKGMKMYQRMNPTFSSDGDFDTENEKNKGLERFSFYYSDFRAMWGSAGA